MLIRLRRIYNFWLFHANIIHFHILFGNFLYYFLGLTYWSSAHCQFLFVACFLFSRNPISNGVQTKKNGRRFFWNIYDFLEVKSTRNGIRGGHEVGGAPYPPRRAPDPRGPPVRRLMLSFWRKKTNFMRKIWAKDSPQSELRISGYKGNGEGVESGNAENAETER